MRKRERTREIAREGTREGMRVAKRKSLGSEGFEVGKNNPRP
jgi:hypothetical protein